MIPDSVTSIGGYAFRECYSLTNAVIGNGVTYIGASAFSHCGSLTNLTIPGSVTNIGIAAFEYCTNLAGLYFRGNAPSAGGALFYMTPGPVTVYYLPGTFGWTTIFDGQLTAAWALPYPVVLTTGSSFGVQTNSFGFRISWATNLSVVVEAATNLSTPAWSPVSTNVLSDGWSQFTESQWTNYPARFYRIRSP